MSCCIVHSSGLLCKRLRYRQVRVRACFRSFRFTSSVHWHDVRLLVQLIPRCARRSEGRATSARNRNCAAISCYHNARDARRNRLTKQYVSMPTRRFHRFWPRVTVHTSPHRLAHPTKQLKSRDLLLATLEQRHLIHSIRIRRPGFREHMSSD